MLPIFSITLILSAFLLFWIELLFAKQILPHLGGVPAVWNGCMMFFQIMLLLGYLWAHLLKKFFKVHIQQLIQISLLIICCIWLPMKLRLTTTPEPGTAPISWLFLTALSSVGLPFFLLASLTPCLQSWLASFQGHSTDQSKGQINPYILYTVSNTGSMLALAAFPFFLETVFNSQKQISLWQGLFIINFIFIATGAIYFQLKNKANNLSSQALEETNQIQTNPTTEEKPKAKTLLKWILFSFLPSSLLLGSTTFITGELSPMPLFWALPLAIYLFTFILVFAPVPQIPQQSQTNLHLVLWLALVAFYCNLISYKSLFLGIAVACNLLLLFLICWLMHGKLALSKPSAKHLTGFYLAIAFGGMLGGIFNSLIAPTVFKALYEYPLAVVACIVALNGKNREIFKVGLPKWAAPNKFLNYSTFAIQACALAFGLILSSAFVTKLQHKNNTNTIEHFRSFFGAYKVTEKTVQIGPNQPIQVSRFMIHGTTNHGKQDISNPEAEREAQAYYARSEPIAEVFDLKDKPNKVAVIGLGTGGLSVYAKAGQSWDFYEVDASVKQMAEKHFTYLKNNPAKLKIIIGDGRLEIAKSQQKYDLLIIDAFSSDSIPTHLLTKEAFEIYTKHLAQNGIIVFHISNRYLSLSPVVEGLVNSTENFQALSKYGQVSQWVVVGQKSNLLMSQAQNINWKKIAKSRLWTDDFSNLFLSLKILDKTFRK